MRFLFVLTGLGDGNHIYGSRPEPIDGDTVKEARDKATQNGRHEGILYQEVPEEEEEKAARMLALQEV